MKLSDSCKFLSFQRDKSRFIHSLFVLFFAILITYTWQRKLKMSSSKRLSPADPNSYARPGTTFYVLFFRQKPYKFILVSDIAKVIHIHLALDVDFDKKILAGSATLSVEKVDSTATQVVLDARGMKIVSAVDDSNGANLDFVLHPEDYVGSKMEVNLPKSTEKV